MITLYTETEGSLIDDVTVAAQNSIEEYYTRVSGDKHSTTQQLETSDDGGEEYSPNTRQSQRAETAQQEFTGGGEEVGGEGISADTWHSGTAETAQQELTGGAEEVGGEGNSVNTPQSHTVELTGDGGEVGNTRTSVARQSTPANEMHIEHRAIDLEEQDKVEHFYLNGCGCASACVRQFTLQHISLTRANTAQLSRGELDMVIMGQVMALTHCSQIPQNTTKHRHQLKQRERNSMAFYHNSLGVCRSTFLFLHNIGEFRLKAIRARYLSEGLVPRIHGHSGRTAPNALVLEDVRGIITFIMQYAETNAILLPGRIPGYKRDDIQLLPSNTTKRAVWMLFQDSTISNSARCVSYSTFCKVWRNFLSHIVICTPMTDLCATCQKNNAAIIRAVNLSEEEKSEVRILM